jgi:hypothetical protein
MLVEPGDPSKSREDRSRHGCGSSPSRVRWPVLLVRVVPRGGFSPGFPIYGFLSNWLFLRLILFLLFEGIAGLLWPIVKTLFAHFSLIPSVDRSFC